MKIQLVAYIHICLVKHHDIYYLSVKNQYCNYSNGTTTQYSKTMFMLWPTGHSFRTGQPIWNWSTQFKTLLATDQFKMDQKKLICFKTDQFLLNHFKIGQFITPGAHAGVCICVSPLPRLLITSGVMWHDMDPIQLVKQVLQLLYGNCSHYH